ncbi:MAG: response regulator transcription factor [Pseudomonadota bacterium]
MNDHRKNVLIVEDDEDIAAAVSRGLRREGYMVSVATDLPTARAALEHGYDAAIVDAMLGQDRGEDLIREIRAAGMRLPIVMLSALSGVEDRARGLEAGADDYVAKPFEFAELVTRLRVQENRRGTNGDELTVDHDRRQVQRGVHTATLTQRELDLLDHLLVHAEQVLTRGEIFDALWLQEGGSAENVVDVYIGYLRRKLGPLDKFGIEIKTVRGRGFLLTRNG